MLLLRSSCRFCMYFFPLGTEPWCGPPACKTGVKFQSKQMIMYFRFDAAFIVYYRFFVFYGGQRRTTANDERQPNEKVLLRNKFNFIYLGDLFCVSSRRWCAVCRSLSISPEVNRNGVSRTLACSVRPRRPKHNLI